MRNQLYINGQWRAGRAGSFPTVDPAAGRTITEVTHTSAEDVDDARRPCR
ncbi:hypothetical protein GCM10009676_38970 [Prauserella halophila]|uniref:Aldehyde dehydrogenase family protein n=1 Tax=Prauserella halophila TaxID=185641 RepID=A0ABP4H819_9PSEU